MGADLLIAHIWTTKPKDAIDFGAALAAIEDCSMEDFDPDGFLVEDEGLTIEAARARAREDIDFLLGLWTNRDWVRDADVCVFGPVTVAISAGMSWGDDPTDAYTQLNRIPEKALRAAGFFE